MAVRTTGGKVHWNYFLALEEDLSRASRYVEFCDANLETFSIEFAHLLLAAASEVDVVAKLLCDRVNAGAHPNNINQYREVLVAGMADIPTTEVSIPRFGMRFCPWENWGQGINPNWWRSYNNVKHQRDAHFNEATLRHSLNALGGLLILVHAYYTFELGYTTGQPLYRRETSQLLEPGSTLLRLPPDFYYEQVYT